MLLSELYKNLWLVDIFGLRYQLVNFNLFVLDDVYTCFEVNKSKYLDLYTLFNNPLKELKEFSSYINVPSLYVPELTGKSI